MVHGISSRVETFGRDLLELVLRTVLLSDAAYLGIINDAHISYRSSLRRREIATTMFGDQTVLIETDSYKKR